MFSGRGRSLLLHLGKMSDLDFQTRRCSMKKKLKIIPLTGEVFRQRVLAHTHPLTESETISLRNWAKESLEVMRSGSKSKKT